MVNGFLLAEFGARVRELRLERGWSQEALSYRSGFHRTYIGMVERGERNISLTHMAVFAKVFGMPLSTLVDFRSVNPRHSFRKYETKQEG